ncbi:hypothetical protein ID866_9997 [Astraeus odoratus]|nr:hypothetical protein ID866_9997 [Astraeus odoratus]
MTGHQFNTLVSVLFIGYMVMRVPSNMLLNRIAKPSVYFSCSIFSWGLFSIGTGSYHAALVSRLLLGFSEASFYPGVIFLLSRWYKRDELGLRMAYLACSSLTSKVLGSLAASGILAVMESKFGIPAWRWLFLIEGGFTCVIAVVGFHVIPDFPNTPVSWLTAEEQMLAQKRVEEDLRGTEDLAKTFQGSGLIQAAMDSKVWNLAIAMAALNATLSFGTFFPTLASTMGYSASVTLLLCAPPWTLGAATSFLVMQRSDATRNRFWYIVGPLSMGIIGFVLAISTMNTSVRYISLFFMAQSTVSYTVLLAWVSNSMPESTSKRAVAIAIVSLAGTIGDIGASYLWPATWGPTYTKSYLGCIFLSCIAIFMLWVYRLHLINLNAKAEMNERTMDLPPGFRYIT